MLLMFPAAKVRTKEAHARSSAKLGGGAHERAASVASASAERHASRATDVPRIAAHHSAGILSLCHHLRTAATPAPISDASASGERHNAITSRNVEKPIMESAIGQSVLNCKAILSHDYETVVGQNWPMEKPGNSAFRRDFIKRVKDARKSRFKKQGPILEILEVDQGTYKQYESRTPLPHHLIPKFCAACGVDMTWLLTGKGKGGLTASRPEKRKQVEKPKSKRVIAS